MPYIKQDERARLDGPISDLARRLTSPGQLNYAIARIIVLWMERLGGVNYFKIALATGVLKNVADELYRRVAAPYEDRKAAESGDVYQEIMTGTEKVQG